MNKKYRGFTLVELMIVTAIVGVAVALAILPLKVVVENQTRFKQTMRQKILFKTLILAEI